jgi:hypothetical protein
VGAVVNTLPATAQPIVINGQNYYSDGANYYQPCFQGSDTSYCVTGNPNN